MVQDFSGGAGFLHPQSSKLFGVGVNWPAGNPTLFAAHSRIPKGEILAKAWFLFVCRFVLSPPPSEF